MDTGESAFNDLVAQYNSMDTNTFPEMVITNSIPWYKKHMMIIVLFIWTLLFIIIGKPSIMYEEDPETKQWKIKPMRLLMSLVFIFISLVATFWMLRMFDKPI